MFLLGFVTCLVGWLVVLLFGCLGGWFCLAVGVCWCVINSVVLI